NELEVVVVASVFANTLYADKFQPGVVSLPICYAFGDPDSDDPEGTMRPHEEAEDPQSDACADCPMNQFGSAPEGRGKACKNTRRLAVMLAEDLDNVEEDRKSTRLNSSHVKISYAVFCLKKKKKSCRIQAMR